MLREALYWQDSIFRLESLLVYRNILRDKIVDSMMKKLKHMTKGSDETDKLFYDFAALLVERAEEKGLSGHLLAKHMANLFLRDENVFTLTREHGVKIKKKSLYPLVIKDLKVLQYFCRFDLKNLCDNIGYEENLYDYTSVFAKSSSTSDEIVQARTPEDLYALIAGYHRIVGAGEMHAAMFKLADTGRPEIIKNPDPVMLADLYVYESQKQSLVDNIEAFLAGYPANNVLLAGSRGNGKSSCVKALVNGYKDRGLRLIEVQKEQIPLLPKLIDQLAKRGKHFIIFMDDLSYDYLETEYKHLKSLLEGGASTTPANVLFFATSNRRHIVHENWEEREEIHAVDSMQEKISLHDRFGLTLFFPNLELEEYIKIVLGMAQKENVVIDAEFLKEQALVWAGQRKNFSGRMAIQFINHIKWEMNKGI